MGGAENARREIASYKNAAQNAVVENARHRKCEKRRICKAESTERQRRWHTVWSVTVK